MGKKTTNFKVLTLRLLSWIDVNVPIREQGRRQRERHKVADLVGKSNSFALPGRACFTFVNFFAVVRITTI